MAREYDANARRLTALLLRATDLYHPKHGVLPGHGAEYDAVMAEIAELEPIVHG